MKGAFWNINVIGETVFGVKGICNEWKWKIYRNMTVIGETVFGVKGICNEWKWQIYRSMTVIGEELECIWFV